MNNVLELKEVTKDYGDFRLDKVIFFGAGGLYLQIFLEFVMEENHTILLSSHITGDILCE